MRCKNDFCIYQSEEKCTLEEICIDCSGLCANCIYPDIDEKILTQAKLKLLRKYDKADNN